MQFWSYFLCIYFAWDPQWFLNLKLDVFHQCQKILNSIIFSNIDPAYLLYSFLLKLLLHLCMVFSTYYLYLSSSFWKHFSSFSFSMLLPDTFFCSIHYVILSASVSNVMLNTFIIVNLFTEYFNSWIFVSLISYILVVSQNSQSCLEILNYIKLSHFKFCVSLFHLLQ